MINVSDEDVFDILINDAKISLNNKFVKYISIVDKVFVPNCDDRLEIEFVEHLNYELLDKFNENFNDNDVDYVCEFICYYESPQTDEYGRIEVSDYISFDDRFLVIAKSRYNQDVVIYKASYNIPSEEFCVFGKNKISQKKKTIFNTSEEDKINLLKSRINFNKFDIFVYNFHFYNGEFHHINQPIDDGLSNSLVNNNSLIDKDKLLCNINEKLADLFVKNYKYSNVDFYDVYFLCYFKVEKKYEFISDNKYLKDETHYIEFCDEFATSYQFFDCEGFLVKKNNYLKFNRNENKIIFLQYF